MPCDVRLSFFVAPACVRINWLNDRRWISQTFGDGVEGYFNPEIVRRYSAGRGHCYVGWIPSSVFNPESTLY